MENRIKEGLAALVLAVAGFASCAEAGQPQRQYKTPRTAEARTATQPVSGTKSNYSESFYSNLAIHEGSREWVYDDATGKRIYPGQKAKGYRTIGVGFNLDRGKDAKKSIEELGLNFDDIYNGKTSLNDVQIRKLLERDVAYTGNEVKRYVKVPLTNNQYEALTSFAFNVGIGKFKDSTLLKKINCRNYSGAANEFSKWNKSKGEVINGLIGRRDYEKGLFLSQLLFR